MPLKSKIKLDAKSDKQTSIVGLSITLPTITKMKESYRKMRKSVLKGKSECVEVEIKIGTFHEKMSFDEFKDRITSPLNYSNGKYIH